MFGYVVINEQELKVKEVAKYRAYYCGFCRELKRKYGIPGQMTLSYDMTFLIMVLCDLYDAEDTIGETRCIAHPLGKHPTRINRFTEYAADMNLILSYYSCLDNWSDEHKVTSLAVSKLIHSREEKASADYGYKAAVIRDRLNKLHAAEEAKETNIDIPAGYFGDIMAELFAVYQDDWEQPLRQMGFYLGKFIYIMDAYDDLEKDEKSGSYNPLLPLKDRPDFDDYCHQLLTMMISKASAAFETLPCVDNLPIIRNILYSGVWTKYNIVRTKRTGGTGTSSDGAGTNGSESDRQHHTSHKSSSSGSSGRTVFAERRASGYDPLDSYDSEALGAGRRQ